MDDVSLRDYVDALFREKERALQAALSAVDKENSARLEELQHRLDLLNEFRSQMTDEADKYALREVVDQRFRDIARRAETKSADNFSRILGGSGIAVAIIAMLAK